MKNLTQKQFIEKAKLKHGNRYDYSVTEYINSRTPIKIICKEHSIVFEQRAGDHLNGHGCRMCQYTQQKKNLLLTKDKFIEIANTFHGDRYDYSISNFIDMGTPIDILCKEHGKFTQIPRNHIRSSGCQICEDGRVRLKESFIQKSTAKHNGIYSYINTNYVNNKTKVFITCPIHGDFEQTPQAHLAGQGCPICGELRKRQGYLNEPTILYYLYLPEYNVYKIGITLVRIGIKRRFKQENKKVKIKVVYSQYFLDGKYAYAKEQKILKKFKSVKTNKNLLVSGNSELFHTNIFNTEKDFYAF